MFFTKRNKNLDAKAPAVVDKLDSKRSYTHFVDGQKERSSNEHVAMAQAIGGQFTAFGIVEREMLKFFGLPADGYLVDVGCGSGRLAIPIAEWRDLRYLGIDVVPDLVEYARKTANRQDWRFEVVDGLKIPEKNGTADMVCFFSVLTHLLHEQSYLYLEEAKRVLKVGGKIVFSFLEFYIPSHWAVFSSTVANTRADGTHPLNVFIPREAITTWAAHLDLDILEIRDGDKPFVPIQEPIALEDGTFMRDFALLGQSICVLQKRRS